MFHVNQVLIPVDFSSFSRCAVAFARQLGAPSPRVQLAHILPEWSPSTRNILFPYAALGEDEVAFEHELVEETRKHLHRYLRVDKALEELFINEPIVRMGRLKTLLPEVVHATDAELIVVGAFGQGGVHPDGLGSTAERILHMAMEPVVLVRDFDPAPKLRHILVAVDLTPESAHVFARALALAIQTGATLEAIHVLPHPLSQDTHKLLAPHIKFNPRDVLKRSEDKIDALFERMRNQVAIPYGSKPDAAERMKKWQVLVGDPATEIVRHADATQADLVVVGSNIPQGRTTRTLGRVSWMVARTAPTHVMVVPPRTQTATTVNEDV